MIKKIIPKFIKNKIKIILCKNQYKNYKKNQNKNKLNSYILFCTPIHGNIGDQAIAIAEYKFLEDIGIKNIFEITSPKTDTSCQALKNLIDDKAIIMIHGGGFLGNQWSIEQERLEKVIKTFPNNKIVIFPQTIYFTNNEDGKEAQNRAQNIFSKHKNLVICAREKKSYSMMKEIFANAKIILIPDIVLYLKKFEKEFKRDGILLCLRKDPEAKLNSQDREKIYDIVCKYNSKVYWTDTVINEVIETNKRKEALYNKLQEFAKSKLVVTDRLHGMIFAAITKTPCIVLGNYNHKVKGVYEWIKDLDYIEYIDNLSEIEKMVKKLYNKEVEKYNKIDKDLYKELKSEIMSANKQGEK